MKKIARNEFDCGRTEGHRNRFYKVISAERT